MREPPLLFTLFRMMLFIAADAAPLLYDEPDTHIIHMRLYYCLHMSLPLMLLDTCTSRIPAANSRYYATRCRYATF